MYKKWDFIWFLTKTLKRENSANLTPTWAAYNSLITNMLPATIYCGLPLYPAPLTDWSNFYTALKLCQNISTAGKTIISLDLQLYSKAIKLQSRDDINRNFVFCPGELQIVFAFLHAMGKYIQDSGIDQTFIEAGLYGPATLNQIEWNGMEAHMVMYLCLHKMYMKEFLTKYPEQENKLQSLISVYLLEFESKDFSNIKIRLQHDDLIEKITEKKIFQSFQQFEDRLNIQPKFLNNHMKMYEVLLLFTRATRQGNWNLHMSSLELMIPYFFVHDLQNYARLMQSY